MFLKEKSSCEPMLPSYLPFDVQAEIMFEGCVNPSCIDKIFLKDQNDFNSLKAILSNEIFEMYKSKIIIDDFYFKNRENIKWGVRK